MPIPRAMRATGKDSSKCSSTCELERGASYREICTAVKQASEASLEGVLAYTDEELVSTDIRGEACTSVFDSKAGIALDSTFVKLVAWYDNKWGYSSKLLDLAREISARGFGASLVRFGWRFSRAPDRNTRCSVAERPLHRHAVSAPLPYTFWLRCH